MTMYVIWYDRKSDFSPDLLRQHNGTVRGASCAEIMAKLHSLQRNHDLTKFSPIEIVGISD